MATEIGRSAPFVGAALDPPHGAAGPGVDAWPGLSALPLPELLYREGYRFSFFQAVRLLQRLLPERRRVGHFEPPGDEAVHFRAHVSLAFPQSEIVPPTYDPAAGGYVIVPAKESLEAALRHPAQMTVAFTGLTGPAGVLPRHYTERLIERVRSHGERRPDPTLRDFLDLFNHRLISLLYRAWVKPRVVVQVEQRLLQEEKAQVPCPPDPFTRYLYSLVGLGTPWLRGRQEYPDEALLFYAGALGHLPRSAAMLTEVLVDWLGLPVKVQQFVGAFYPLPQEGRSCLGEVACELGQDAFLGDQAYVQDAKFRVCIGPLPLARYVELLPAGQGGSQGHKFRQLVQLVRLIAGPELDFDIQLLLAPGDLAGCVLGAEASFAPRLGQSAWLLAEEQVPGLADTIFAGTLSGLVNLKEVSA